MIISNLNDIENQLDNIIIKKEALEYHKENFIKEFKFLLLNGFFLYLINFDFYPVFIYSDMSFSKIYFELSFSSFNNFEKFCIQHFHYLNIFDYQILYDNIQKPKIIITLYLYDVFDIKIHYFKKINKYQFFFTFFFNTFHLSLFHPSFDLYDILYDGFSFLIEPFKLL